MNHLIQFFLSTDFQFSYERAGETVFHPTLRRLLFRTICYFLLLLRGLPMEKFLAKNNSSFNEEKIFFSMWRFFFFYSFSLVFQKYFISLMKALKNWCFVHVQVKTTWIIYVFCNENSCLSGREALINPTPFLTQQNHLFL